MFNNRPGLTLCCFTSTNIIHYAVPIDYTVPCCSHPDLDVVGSATCIFVVASVKVPQPTLDLISAEMNHPLPDQRINAIHRFQVLWRNRY